MKKGKGKAKMKRKKGGGGGGRGGREEEGKYVLKRVPFFPEKLGEVVLTLPPVQTACSLQKSLW